MSDYKYDAVVLDVYDGDTVSLRVDLGFHTFVNMKIRLFGINTPELNTDQGKLVRDYLKKLIPFGSVITLNSIKDKPDKYGGRWLGILYLLSGLCVNEELIRLGYAKPWDGKGDKPKYPGVVSC